METHAPISRAMYPESLDTFAPLRSANVKPYGTAVYLAYQDAHNDPAPAGHKGERFLIALAAPMNTDGSCHYDAGESFPVDVCRYDGEPDAAQRTAALYLAALQLATEHEAETGEYPSNLPRDFVFYFDGTDPEDACTLSAFLRTIADPDTVTDSEDLYRVLTLQPGQENVIGGGSACLFTISRPE